MTAKKKHQPYCPNWNETTIMKYHTLPPTITVDQYAAIIGVSRRTVFNLIKCGEVKSMKIGRSRRISTQSLIERLGLDPNLVLNYLNDIA